MYNCQLDSGGKNKIDWTERDKLTYEKMTQDRQDGGCILYRQTYVREVAQIERMDDGQIDKMTQFRHYGLWLN